MAASIWSPTGSLMQSSPWYSVVGWGVTGDGTDEVAKMHAAIAAVPSGATLFIPAGFNVRIGSQLTISNNITLLGYGATITELAGFTGTSLIRSTVANTAVEGLRVVGLSTGKSGINSPGTNLGGFTVRRCDVSGCGYGILGNNNSGVLIEENYVHNNSLYGIWCQNTLNAEALSNVKVKDNVVDTSHLDPTTSVQVCILVRGTETYPTTNVSVGGNRMIMPLDPTNSGALGCEVRYGIGVDFTNNYGLNGAMTVSIALSSEAVVANNVCDGQTFYAIEIASTIPVPNNEIVVANNTILGRDRLNYGIGLQGTQESANCTVVGNTVRDTLQYGIFVSNLWASVAIGSNTIYMTSTGASYGIYCLGSASDITNIAITGNILLGNALAKKAIYLYDTSNVAVTGNVLVGWTENGVLLHSVAGTINNITISGNSFSGVAGRIATFGAGAFGTSILAVGNAGYAVTNAVGTDILNLSNNLLNAWGTNTPEGAITAGIGSTFRRSNGSTGTSFYVKESGVGNTGWIAK